MAAQQGLPSIVDTGYPRHRSDDLIRGKLIRIPDDPRAAPDRERLSARFDLLYPNFKAQSDASFSIFCALRLRLRAGLLFGFGR